jgi:GABA permease
MHNPLRSEREVFRAVVVIGIGAGAVIALALLTRPAFGAVLLAIEAGLGIWVLWRRARGTLPHQAEVARDADDAYRVIVLANQTVGGRALLEEIKNRCSGRKSEILVVVPALTSSPLEHWASDVDGAIAEAKQRLEDSLGAMESAGLIARGTVGDHHEPNAALEDALRYFAADEVIISTHPPQKSKWLERGVVDRARREVPLPITHVVVDLEAEAAGTAGASGTAA